MKRINKDKQESKDINSLFLECCKKNHFDIALKLLKDNFEILLKLLKDKQEPKDINSLFLESCKENKFELALKLLDEVPTIDINISSKISNYTPFLHAISYKNYKAATEFIKKGADVNKIAGYTADFKTCALDLLTRQELTDEVGELIKLIFTYGGTLDLVVRDVDIVTIIVCEDNGRLIDFLFKNNYLIDKQPSIVSGYSVIGLATYMNAEQVIEACLNRVKPDEELVEAATSLAETTAKIARLIRQAWENNIDQDSTEKSEVSELTADDLNQDIVEREVTVIDYHVIGDGVLPWTESE